MAMQKLLIPLQGDFVAPRFDLATEVIIVRLDKGKVVGEPKTIIMERPSDEALCKMVVEEHITDLVCGGIEELHYNFLVWKKVTVLDAVIGCWQTVMEKFLAGTLGQGEILVEPEGVHLSL